MEYGFIEIFGYQYYQRIEDYFLKQANFCIECVQDEVKFNVYQRYSQDLVDVVEFCWRGLIGCLEVFYVEVVYCCNESDKFGYQYGVFLFVFYLVKLKEKEYCGSCYGY